MEIGIIIAIAAAVGVLVGAVVLIASRTVRIPPNQIGIVTGRRSVITVTGDEVSITEQAAVERPTKDGDA